MKKPTLVEMEYQISEVDRVQNEANRMMNELFPTGRIIYFRRSNMVNRAKARVIWARMMQGCANLRITNLDTGKDRNINFNDVEII